VHAYSQLPSPCILAHQGLWQTCPPNTLEAFSRAIEFGADVIETDAHSSKEGIAVLFHDDKIYGRKINEFSIDELPAYVPTLEAALTSFPQTLFNIDIKSSAAEEPVARTISNHNAQNRVLITSFSSQRRKRTMELVPGVAHSPAMAEMIRTVVWSSLGAHRRAVNILKNFEAVQIPTSAYGINLVSPKMMKIYREAQVQVHVWTINDPEEMKKLFSLGVDGIVTDRTDVAQEIRSTYFDK